MYHSNQQIMMLVLGIHSTPCIEELMILKSILINFSGAAAIISLAPVDENYPSRCNSPSSFS